MNYEENDKKVKDWTEKLSPFADRFVLISKPEDLRFLEWYKDLQQQYNLPTYLKIDQPDRYLMQIRYKSDDNTEIFFFSNAHKHEDRGSRIHFAEDITKGRNAWVWDAETGKSFRLLLEDNSFELKLGPAESRIIVFNKEKKGEIWKDLPLDHPDGDIFNNNWEVEFHHSRENWVKTMQMDELMDLKDTDYVRFTGTVIYKKEIEIDKNKCFINLGKVGGISELFVNGKSQGVKWYGNRIYKVAEDLIQGLNKIEIHVVTTMGNYMQTLTDNKTAQKYTNRKGREQEIQSMGLVGPLTIYPIN